MTLQTENAVYLNNFFFINSGKWKDIPHYDYISIYRAKMYRTAKSTLNDDNLREFKYKLQIIKGKYKIQIALFDEKDEALMAADKFSKCLNLKIYNSTLKEWIG